MCAFEELLFDGAPVPVDGCVSTNDEPKTFADLFGLTISQGGLNMLRRSQTAFALERDMAIVALRREKVVASDETGVRIEGSNAYQWVFRSSEAVVHRAAPTRGTVVVRDLMDGHRPEVWCSDCRFR